MKLNARLLVHSIFIAAILMLCIIIPVINSLTGEPPYWAIILLFAIPTLLYIMLLAYIKLKYNHNSPLTMDIEQQSRTETTRLQADEDEVPSMETTSYNPSTVGIPPSSFLAPTIHQQPSIRSSSLDYIPPPPAYQDMIYPPSYRSTSSTKDDNVPTVY